MFKLYAFRAVATLALPFILPTAYLVTLFREIRSAFNRAYLEVRIEFESYTRMMHMTMEEIEQEHKQRDDERTN